MKLPDVQKYLNELVGLLNERERALQAVDQLTAIMRAADSAGDRNQQMALEKQRAGFAKQAAVVEQEAINISRARDAEGARQLATDLSIRIKDAQDAYVEWRKMVNAYEYDVAHARFAPEPEEGQAPQGFTRKMADLELDKGKAEAEQRVAFAAKAVPERSVVLL